MLLELFTDVSSAAYAIIKGEKLLHLIQAVDRHVRSGNNTESSLLTWLDSRIFKTCTSDQIMSFPSKNKLDERSPKGRETARVNTMLQELAGRELRVSRVFCEFDIVKSSSKFDLQIKWIF